MRVLLSPQKKEFPYNLEQSLFGRELNIPKGPERKAAIIRVALQQLLQCLSEAHSVGIVHRDVKPQNCILSEKDSKIKLIDFGAAADLRIGAPSARHTWAAVGSLLEAVPAASG